MSIKPMPSRKWGAPRPEWVDWRIPDRPCGDPIYRVFRYRSAQGGHVSGATADTWLFGTRWHIEFDLEADPKASTAGVRTYVRGAGYRIVASVPMPATVEELQAWCQMVVACYEPEIRHES